jgi:diguanylate cyclase (GGDEF)-like protein
MGSRRFAGGNRGPREERSGRRSGARLSLRAISIASALVFGLLAVVAMVLAVRTEDHVEATRAAGHGARGFGTVSGLVQGQELLIEQYGTRSGAEYQFVGETRKVRGILADLEDSRRTAFEAEQLAVTYDRFVSAAAQYFGAVDSGKTGLARELDRRNLAPITRELIGLTVPITQQNADQADSSSARLEAVTDFMVIVLAIAFLIAGATLFRLARAGQRSQRREAEAVAEVRLLEHAALTDSLTGLRNHRAFEEDLAAMIAETGRTNSPLCLVSFDVEGLKKVNDALGHQVGDGRLRQVAAALLASASASDRVYRVGGDEFALLMPDVGAWTGFSAAERARAELGTSGADVDVAAGVAEAQPLEGKYELIRHADVALINAKRTHRQVIVYSPELDATLDGASTRGVEHQSEVLSTALARAVDAKDTYTRSHSETVSNLCVLIAAQLGIDPDRIAKLRIAGLLHDVGKIGTPDAILNKPTSLTDEEYEAIKEHPVLGEGILRAADLDVEATWVRHHHERPDGRGYPDGMGGSNLPIESRIIGVADAFEAMISDRPYRKGRSETEALEELERYAGAQFDPECVRALRRGLQIPDEDEIEVGVNGGPARQQADRSHSLA